MCTSNNQAEQAQHKVLRLKNKLANGMLNATDYNFYLELYQIAILQYRKLKATA